LCSLNHNRKKRFSSSLFLPHYYVIIIFFIFKTFIENFINHFEKHILRPQKRTAVIYLVSLGILGFMTHDESENK